MSDFSINSASDKSIQEHQGMKNFYHGMRNLCSGYMRVSCKFDYKSDLYVVN